jgi:hypothetical protein
MTSLPLVLAMFAVGAYLLWKPVSSDVENVPTVLVATALIWGANGMLIMWFWRVRRGRRHDT